MNEEFKQQLWQTTLPHMNIRKCSKQFSNTQIFKYQPQVVKIKAFLKLMSLYILFLVYFFSYSFLSQQLNSLFSSRNLETKPK